MRVLSPDKPAMIYLANDTVLKVNSNQWEDNQFGIFVRRKGIEFYPWSNIWKVVQ